MENESKLVTFFKKITDSETALKRLPFYFFLICVLLVVLIFKLGKTNEYLKIIAENGTNNIEYETYDDTFIAAVSENEKDIADYVPLLEEVTEESAEEESTTKTENKSSVSETTTKSSTESTTKSNKSVTTTQQVTDDGSAKTTYVINISSKKIHLADCSFVARTKEENKKTVNLSDSELKSYLNDGYTLCKTCGGD